ncbi:hypothetical protein AB0I53_45010 [Saccharopolyspora sp. NPDC050389]|uniref:hypothetical protein n=1 Tax=Saccharopolyspora sp. NPDC050389 TaxID=3155516 RepID=UPI0033C56DDD
MDRSHRRQWLMRLPLWASFIALFVLAMWCNVRLIALTLTDGSPDGSVAETWYVQGLVASLVGSGLLFCLVLLCGTPGSTRTVRGRATRTHSSRPQSTDHSTQPAQGLGDRLWLD